MTTERLIAVALIVLCCAPITFILLRARMVAWWHRVMSRLAVEVRRARPVRREGKHTEARLDMQWADDIAPCCTHPGTGICMCDCHDDLAPLPLYDEGIAIRERYRREAWAATGVTPDEYWRSQPTPGQRAGYWEERAIDVLPERVIRVLEHARADQTVIDSDLTPETRTALVEEFAGGDPYNGEGEHWFDAFDRIEARAHERLQQARAELDRWFTPVGAS